MPLTETPTSPPNAHADSVDELYTAIMRQLPQAEERDVQRHMVRAVTQALESKQALLLEAGTGAGKTYGYLIPAMLRQSAGEPVVISTGTIALQEQLINKDIPVLSEALEKLDRRAPKVKLVKGRGNYLCIQKLQEQLKHLGNAKDRASQAARLSYQQLVASLEQGWEGDIATLDTAPSKAVWNEVRSTAEECLGWRCQYYQENPYRLSREDLDKADILVVNHALYFQDLASNNSLLPEHSTVIFDEAHSITNYAMGAFTSRIGKSQTTRLLQTIQRRVAPVPDSLLDTVTEADATLLHWLLEVADKRPRFVLPRSGVLYETVSELGVALKEIRTWLSSIELSLDSAPNEKAEKAIKLQQQHRDKLLQQLESLMDAWRWFLAADASFDHMERVNWVEVNHQHLYYTLHSTPLAVDSLLEDNLWSERQGILTSATLAVKDSLNYSRTQLGLPPEAECLGLVLESPFQYAKQGLLYLPPKGLLPDSVLDDTYFDLVSEHLEQLLTATQGRALVLFTSYQRMQAVGEVLFGALDYPLRVQGDMPQARLIEWFKQTPNAVLLATATFWEGIDIPGEALSCVVIEKLPFSPPDDPVHQTQVDKLKRHGQNWFGQMVLPQTILKLKQGVGRLIRTQQDRGVLALLDPRLRTKTYGRQVLAALPPMAQTSNLVDVAQFLAESSS